MIAIVAVALLVFTLAGWLGTRVGAALCPEGSGFPDGPAPVYVPDWVFAAAAGCAGALAAAHGQNGTALAALALIAVAITACAWSDLRYGIVPDVCTVIPLAAIVVAAASRGDFGPAFGAAFVGLPFSFAALLSRGRGMGWGDAKLAALGGALLGAQDATFAFFGACLAAYLWAIVRRRRTRPTAFAPYLAGAVATVLALGPVR